MKEYLLIGSYTEKDAPGCAENSCLGEGLTIFAFENGRCGRKLYDYPLLNPSYMAATDNLLFAVSERGNTAAVYSFQWNADEIVLKDRFLTFGSASCHLMIQKEAKRLVVSNYGSGSAISFQYTKEGELQEEAVFEAKGNGPVKNRQEKSHIHSSIAYGQEILLADLGGDCIWRCKIQNEVFHIIDRIQCSPGDGPRHMIIQEDILYVVHELSNCVAAYDLSNGGRKCGRIPVSKQTYKKNLASGIIQLSNGNLLVSNRGDNTLVELKTDVIKKNACEKMVLFQEAKVYSSKGKNPRYISHKGNIIIAANQADNSVVLLDRNGTLLQSISIGAPVYAEVIAQ